MRIALVFFILFAVLRTHAQAPAAPAGGGGGGGGAAVGAGAAAGGAAAFSAGTGLSNIGGTFVPGALNSGAILGDTGGSPTLNSVGGVPAGTGMSATISTCLAAVANIGGYTLTNANWEAMRGIREAADKENEQKGFEYENNTNVEHAKRAGESINKLWGPGEQGCQKFIDKEGKVGPWGRTALEEMKKYEENYTKVPLDISIYCPAFGDMDKDRKQYFWLWFFASLSKPESGCRTNAVNPNAPNGNAIGLFQLEAPACARVGVYVSSQDLLNASDNIRCAVALIAKEMKSRTTLMVETSKGPRGTYFGTLRNDDFNKARGADISGAQQARALLSNFDDCKK